MDGLRKWHSSQMPKGSELKGSSAVPSLPGMTIHLRRLLTTFWEKQVNLTVVFICHWASRGTPLPREGEWIVGMLEMKTKACH